MHRCKKNRLSYTPAIKFQWQQWLTRLRTRLNKEKILQILFIAYTKASPRPPLTEHCGYGRHFLPGVVLVKGVKGAVLGRAGHGLQVMVVAHSLWVGVWGGGKGGG